MNLIKRFIGWFRRIRSFFFEAPAPHPEVKTDAPHLEAPAPQPDAQITAPEKRSTTPLDPKLIAAAIDPLGPFLSGPELIRLGQTSLTIFYSPNFKKSKLHRTLTRLAEIVLLNNPAKVGMMFENISKIEGRLRKRRVLKKLLCEPVPLPEMEPSGKPRYKMTAFQAALCTRNSEMIKLFIENFNKLPDGQTLMDNQIIEIFPGGIEEYTKSQQQQASAFIDTTLTDLISVITKASVEDLEFMCIHKESNSPLGEAISAFRDKIQSAFFKDRVSNRFYLGYALEKYTFNYSSFTSQLMKDLFCVQVIGYIQRFSPARDLQAFAQGLYNLTVIEDRYKFEGSFKFANIMTSWVINNQKKLEPIRYLEIKPKSGLGFDWWATDHGISEGAAPGAALHVGFKSLLAIERYSHSNLIWINEENQKLFDILTQSANSTPDSSAPTAPHL